MKKKNGFTLVELLAVIVILAIILVIAVPQIMNTIRSATEGSLRSSAKMIVSAIENDYTVQQVLGNAPANVAADTACPQGVANYNTSEYTCTYQLTDGVATVKLDGTDTGKFKGCHAFGVTSDNDGTVVCS